MCSKRNVANTHVELNELCVCFEGQRVEEEEVERRTGVGGECGV